MRVNEGYFSLDSLSRGARYFLGKDGFLPHLRDRFFWYLCPKIGIAASFPTHVDIEASNRCQLKCPMCARRAMEDVKEGLIDFNLFKSLADQCARKNVYSIKLSWRGEPLLHPDIFKMVRYAKDKKIKDVAFLTNLERLNDNMAEEMVESGIDWISVSIDGMEENYNKIRYPSKFADIVKKIKTINEIKNKLGKKKPMIRIQSIWSAIGEDPFTYKGFWMPLVDKINFIADQKRYEKVPDFPINCNFRCQSPWLRMFISCNGKVVNCAADYSEKNILGDATKESLEKIWQGPGYKALRVLHKTGAFVKFKPCITCDKRGLMREETVKRGNETIRFKTYIDQEFIKNAAKDYSQI